MKNLKYSSLIVLLLIVCFLAIFVSGCISPTVTAPAVPAQPAIPAQPAATNPITGAITPAVPAVPAQAAIPAQVVYAPSQKLADISSNEATIYGQYAPVVGAVYAPAAPILSAAQGVFGAVMSIVTGVSLFWAGRKNKQALLTQANLDTAQGVVKSVVQGVESAGAAAAAIKQSIAKTAIANGNADHVENAVNAVTGHA